MLFDTPADDLTLREAIEKLYYGAECKPCGEVRYVNLLRAAARCGLDMKVRELRPRLRCSKCGNKAVIVTTLWRSASTSEQAMRRWVSSE